jgi:hypothetical protein
VQRTSWSAGLELVGDDQRCVALVGLLPLRLLTERAGLTAAIAAIPGTYRRKILVRLDGAGFSHKLLEHIVTGGGVKGRSWEFSVDWACTDREIEAIDKTPRQVWQPGIDQDGNPLADVWVADIPPQAGGAPRPCPPNRNHDQTARSASEGPSRHTRDRFGLIRPTLRTLNSP